MRYISLIIVFLLFSLGAKAQEDNVEHVEKPPVNKLDDAGRRTGIWWITVPARMGEPQVTEFGNYIQGMRNGKWYKISHLGELISIETFKKDVLDGEVKYFELGKMYCTGNYRGVNPANEFDTIMVIDPDTHLESFRVISTDRGSVRHGLWRYYDPHTGYMIKEEEYVVDELVYRKEFTISPKTDSLYLQQREKGLPHTKNKRSVLPFGKR